MSMSEISEWSNKCEALYKEIQAINIQIAKNDEEINRFEKQSKYSSIIRAISIAIIILIMIMGFIYDKL